MDTEFYTQMLKEQKKLRSRLARKSHEKQEVEKELVQLLTNHTALVKKYRLSKFRAEKYLEDCESETKRADSNYESGKVLFFLFIISLVANLYFIFK